MCSAVERKVHDDINPRSAHTLRGRSFAVTTAKICPKRHVVAPDRRDDLPIVQSCSCFEDDHARSRQHGHSF